MILVPRPHSPIGVLGPVLGFKRAPDNAYMPVEGSLRVWVSQPPRAQLQPCLILPFLVSGRGIAGCSIYWACRFRKSIRFNSYTSKSTTKQLKCATVPESDAMLIKRPIPKPADFCGSGICKRSQSSITTAN